MRSAAEEGNMVDKFIDPLRTLVEASVPRP